MALVVVVIRLMTAMLKLITLPLQIAARTASRPRTRQRGPARRPAVRQRYPHPIRPASTFGRQVPVYRLNPPPGWPPPPSGFVPRPGWQPDPAWPAPPPGWQVWIPANESARRLDPRRQRNNAIIIAASVVGAVLLLAAIGSVLPKQPSATPIAASADTPTTKASAVTTRPAASPGNVAAPPVVTATPTRPTPVSQPTTPQQQSPAQQTPTPQSPQPQPPAAPTCGAPPNSDGLNFCGRGSLVTNPPADVCSVFSCIQNFYNGIGYLEQCNDGMVSMSGGRRGACSRHGGEKQPIYQG